MRPSERIDGKRLWQRHMELARFGAREDGGVDRQALSDAEIEARAQIVAWGQSLGLSPFTDGAANLFLRFDGSEPGLPPVLAGSHIDSQPTGGKFDGAYGVLAALESVQAMREAGLTPLRPIEIVAWMNEEGSRFAPGMTGSELFTGGKVLDALVDDRDGTGVRLGDAIDHVLAADAAVPLRPFKLPVAAYVEPHIEQGPLLERAKCPVGVVTGIQGTRRYRVRVHGEAAHAGTAERHERKDALMAAVRMIAAIDEIAMRPADTKLTVGLFDVKPNAPSVVPAEVYFALDLRHPDNAVVDHIDAEIRQIVEHKRGPCLVDLQQIQHSPSLNFNPAIRSLIAAVATQLGIAHQDIYSAAGHDSRQLHYFCPTGMIFIPCRDGISHNPAEWSEPDDLTAGARVLADTIWQLANKR